VKLINCKKCGTLFQKKLRDICDTCLEQDNTRITSIENYVKNCAEQFISFKMINNFTGIEMEAIEELYKQGRLTIITGRLLTKCKICGIEVKGVQAKGNFCAKCYNTKVTEDEGAKKAIFDPKNANIELRKFDKNIIHTNKVIPPDERMKYGFKKSYE
jgi:hypothetical protein